MAKKFGKFLVFTAAVGAAVAGTYYYLQKKSHLASEYDFDDDDYDDFSEDLGESDAPRSYVPLTKETEASQELNAEFNADNTSESNFSSLAEDVTKKVDETVEEFFDEEEK